MNLFALTSNPGARIIRFPLTQELQTDIDEVFRIQQISFLSEITDVIPFDGRYIPDEGELLLIENFEDVDGLGDAVRNPITVEQFNPNIHSLEHIKALFASRQDEGVERILIQMFESRRLIATRGLAIFFSGNTFQRMSDAGLTLDTRLLAVLEGGALKFQSFHFLRRVFDLSEYFNEATSDEITAFASHDKLSVNDVQGFVAAASPLIRKKIALIRQSGILDNFTTEQIVGTAQAFNLPIQTTMDGRIVLPENKTELRRILRFLDEDYYQSPLSQTHYVSNSKRVAD